MVDDASSQAVARGRRFQFKLRDLGFTVTIAGLLIGMFYTQHETRSRLQSEIDGLQQRIDRTEMSHDVRERQLIQQLHAGDRLSQHPDFLILADYEIERTNELYLPFIQFYFECVDCQDYLDYRIFVFSLEFDRIEGVNSFYVVVEGDTITRVISGEAVCS